MGLESESGEVTIPVEESTGEIKQTMLWQLLPHLQQLRQKVLHICLAH